MPKAYYDLHIHSCLSPCSSEDMTPNNIVHMAKLKGLNVIAVTDHNSCKNCEAVFELGKKNNILVVPALELQTSEDIHFLCYFGSLESALDFEKNELKNMPFIQNREDIFGEQTIMDARDTITGKVEGLLIHSSGISAHNIIKIVKNYGGAVVPAHIDRHSFSILEVLGEIPPDLGIKTAEVSKEGAKSKFFDQNKLFQEEFSVIINSDAHHLWDISESEYYIESTEASLQSVINFLKGH